MPLLFLALKENEINRSGCTCFGLKLHNPGLPQTHDAPASAARVLGLRVFPISLVYHQCLESDEGPHKQRQQVVQNKAVR